MGHHLGVFTGTCNRKSFCFASIMAELAALNLGIESQPLVFPPNYKAQKRSFRSQKLSPKTAAFTFFVPSAVVQVHFFTTNYSFYSLQV